MESPFICGECELTFKRVEHLVDHTRTEHTSMRKEPDCNNESLIKCDNCKDIFATVNILTRHRRIALMGGNLNCNLHMVEVKYNDHMKEQQLFLMLGNKTLNNTFNNQPRKKQKKKKTQSKSTVCPLCFKTLRQNFNLNRHIYNVHDREKQMENNSGEKLFSCQVCPFTDIDYVALKTHQRTQTDIKHKPYICDTCQKSYKTKDNLKSHVCTNSEETLFSCKVCPFVGSDYDALKNHQKSETDSKHKPYTCNICKKSYMRKTKLKFHLCTEAGSPKKIKQSLKTYKCASCDRICQHKRILRDHTRKYHHSEQALPCKKCDLVFPDLHHLNLHKIIHPEYSQYLCKICFFASNGISHLRKHLRTHTGEKPYKCDICQKRFSGKDKLKYHRSRHENTITNKCIKCSITCLNQNDLDHHNKKVHNIELQHMCKNCGSKFPDIPSLHKHVLVCCFTIEESIIKFEPTEENIKTEQDKEI